MSLTRSNIAYDLKASPHETNITYPDGDVLTFIFSSDLYRTKFTEKMKDNRIKINESLSNRFGFTIVNDKLCDLKLYTTIEKRGFLIYQNQRGFECLNNIILDGHQLMRKL